MYKCSNALSEPVLTVERLATLFAFSLCFLISRFRAPQVDMIYMQLAGDYTQMVTPVPIPNTAVKHLGPMVVRLGRE